MSTESSLSFIPLDLRPTKRLDGIPQSSANLMEITRLQSETRRSSPLGKSPLTVQILWLVVEPEFTRPRTVGERGSPSKIHGEKLTVNRRATSCKKFWHPVRRSYQQRRWQMWRDILLESGSMKMLKFQGAQDVTLNPMAGNNDNSAFTWVHIDLEPVCSEARHLSSKGNIPDSGQILLPTKLGVVRRNEDTIPRRVHARIVFHDVGVALKDVTLLADNLRCLCHALKGLHYLHKAGWVHRDFSVGNAIWIADDNGGTGIGKLGDFEYAKRMDSDISHDVRTGTMHFMAVEVEYQGYLFQPSIASRSIYHDPLGIISPDASSTIRTRPSFRMNFLHDIESAWWAFAWVFFYHTETTSVHHPFDAQWNEFQKAFPGAIDHTSRQNFFMNSARLEEALGTLSDACQPFCSNILFFAEVLKQSYRKAEKPYPELALDVLAYETHDKAFNYIQDAQSKAGSIVLQPLPEALNNKRKRTGPEGEISQRAS
ncbi:hypothetical protein JVU11DRAFT_9352 [Chiua virens]|nr:hypothetical protein JVU11DRAFT_9352 [Chiua virens]